MTVDRREIASLFAEVSLGAPEAAVGFVLWRVMHRYQRLIDHALLPSSLTHLQFTTLAMVGWLSREGDPPTQAKIARGADVHPMQVSLMLKALETKAMIRRTPSPRRANAKTVEITPQGLAALRIAMPLAIDVQQEMFGNEGRVGGALLSALLRIEATAETEPPAPGFSGVA